jgi:hypothetical protein
MKTLHKRCDLEYHPEGAIPVLLIHGDQNLSLSQSRYSTDETVRRAQELYEQLLRARLEPEHQGKYVAIDIETGEYEFGADYHAAAHTILSRKPDAAIGVLRIGYPAVGRIGGRVKAVQA